MSIGRIWLPVLAALTMLSGCVTVAEFRKLERDVRRAERGEGPAGGESRERLADFGVTMASLESEVERLAGRMEVVERRVEEAMEEARAARADAAAGAVAPSGDGALLEDGAAAEGVEGSGEAVSAEVQAYRTAYAAWRGSDAETCIDRFRNFLQTYPSSAYADDASYWMADCYFKNGDYKTAVLRFDDVVARYPMGNKAPDALYRQGEALLRLGPGYGKAAGKAFERVLKEYPDSARAPEAKKQLDLLGSG